MKFVKLIFILLTVAVCAAFPLHVTAEETTEITSTALDCTTKPLLGASGQISSFYVVCTAGSGSITYSARTTAPQVMAKIGQINIRIQRSSDGVSGWTDYRTLTDKFSENTSFHYYGPYTATVSSGYYRIVLTHYAKEKGWFFPKTQTVEQTSVVVHVG